MASILTIDDDSMIQGLLSQHLAQLGHESVSALIMEDGLKKAEAGEFDLVILDLDFPEGNGLEILPALLECASSPEVIILTGTGDKKGAKLAYDYGAWDFLQKPFLKDEVSLSVSRALQYRTEKQDRQELKPLKRAGIIGNSPQIEHCLDLVGKAAVSNANVLLTGDSGTGKELFARAIHENSQRDKNSFVVVDCAVLTESLVENTLFGHEKGAFTGADKAHDGLIK